jgi:hypothetical protein
MSIQHLSMSLVICIIVLSPLTSNLNLKSILTTIDVSMTIEVGTSSTSTTF